MNQDTRQDVADAERLLDGVREDWMSRTGVRAVGVGLIRDEHHVVTKEVGIQVTVIRKLPEEQVPKDELFPPRLGRFRVQLIEGKPGLESPGK
jgi:hypothetical protein